MHVIQIGFKKIAKKSFYIVFLVLWSKDFVYNYTNFNIVL